MTGSRVVQPATCHPIQSRYDLRTESASVMSSVWTGARARHRQRPTRSVSARGDTGSARFSGGALVARPESRADAHVRIHIEHGIHRICVAESTETAGQETMDTQHLRRVVRGLLLCLLVSLSSCCGDGGSSDSGGMSCPWGELSPAQCTAAERAGVPPAFVNALGMRFVIVPAGTFLMGGVERTSERPPHTVVLSRPYYIQVTETTNEHFLEFRRDHVSPSWEGSPLDGLLCPVVSVSWEEAVEFAEWLSRLDGTRRYRLPTEAEWEYACRARASERYYWGDSQRVAGRFANVGDLTIKAVSPDSGVFATDDGWFASAPCGSFLPNRWGLHDMLGNVWEWCADWHAPYGSARVEDPEGPAGGTLRVWRGGSWAEGPSRVRSAQRGCGYPFSRVVNVGFRLVSPTDDA